MPGTERISFDVLHAFNGFNLQEQQQLAVRVCRPDIGAHARTRAWLNPQNQAAGMLPLPRRPTGFGYFDPFICG